MIEFKKVRCKNFLSYGNYWTEIDFSALGGTTLITGKNASGKSSIILDTLAYGLFGKPYRFVNKPRLVNSINGSDCVVEVEFEISNKKYKIIRGIKPNIFEIYCDGILLNQSSKILDYQRYLESHILKLNFDSFCQIVVLGSATFVPFMELSAQDRRSVIEDLLDLKVFSLMNDSLKTKYIFIKDAIKSSENKISNLQDKLVMQKDYCAKLEANLKINNDNINQQISDNQDKIKVLEVELSQVEDKLKDFDELKASYAAKNKEINKYNSVLNSLKDKLSKNKSEIDFYTNNDSCGSCGQNIDTNFKEQIISQRKSSDQKVSAAVEDVKTTISKIQTEANEINEKISHHIKLSYLLGEKNAEISLLNKQIISLTKSLSSGDTTVLDDETKKISLIESDLNKSQTEKESLISTKKNYDIVSLLLKDSGIKSKIIKQYLPTINKCINKYLAAMDFFVNFNLDENFKETIKSRNRDVFEYNSFSQGEKFRIDMALMLTWREISKSKNSVNTNILVLDEVFDGSMDSHGTEEFMKLINHVANGGVSVIVISHKNDSYTDKFNNYIKVEKKSNFSRMEIL
jgi:DNA repair exonuclease SbcCD ATPase subunit